MVDTNILVLNWLAADTTLATLIQSNGIFSPQLPKDFNPSNGVGITVKVAGGNSEEETPIIKPRVQITAWAKPGDYQAARTAYNRIHDWLHQKNMVDFGDLGMVLSSLEESHGQDITDPDTGWATVVVFFNMKIRGSVTGDTPINFDPDAVSFKDYVDSQDELFLAAAEAYTDSSIAALSFPSQAYVDSHDASTLATAEAYTDSLRNSGLQIKLAGASNPPSSYTNDGPASGWNPFIFQQDNSSVWHAIGGVDSSTASPSDGTLTFVRRMYFRDNKATAQVGKNAFISINHLTGTGVSASIQDRAVWISHSTPSGSYSCYGIEGLQIEMDINGTPTFTGSPDGEAMPLSLQMADTHQGNLAPPTGYGAGMIRAVYFREDTAGCWTSPIALCLMEYENISTVAGNGQTVGIFKAKAEDLTGTAKNIPIYYFWAAPKTATSTYRFASNYGFVCENFGNHANDYNFYSQGVNSSGTAAGFNAFQGPTTLGTLNQASSGYQLDITGKIKLTATGGASYLDFFGSTSGSAGIGVAAVAGSPNSILLPTATGASGSFLKTDGANPQQTSWAALSYTDVSGLSTVAHTGSYSDLSSLPTLPANTVATTSQFFTAYNSSTGVFTKAQPAFTDISGTVALATQASGALPASSMPILDGGFFMTETGIAPLSTIFANSSGNITANNMVRGYLFILKGRYTISKYGFDATATGATSPVMDVGIMDTSFNLLTHSGAIALSGAAAAYNGNLLTTITIGPGAFYFVFTGNATASITSVAAVSIVTNSGQAAFSTMLNSSRQRYWNKANAATAGVLPNTISSPTTGLSTDAFAPAVLFE